MCVWSPPNSFIQTLDWGGVTNKTTSHHSLCYWCWSARYTQLRDHLFHYGYPWFWYCMFKFLATIQLHCPGSLHYRQKMSWTTSLLIQYLEKFWLILAWIMKLSDLTASLWRLVTLESLKDPGMHYTILIKLWIIKFCLRTAMYLWQWVCLTSMTIHQHSPWICMNSLLLKILQSIQDSH